MVSHHNNVTTKMQKDVAGPPTNKWSNEIRLLILIFTVLTLIHLYFILITRANHFNHGQSFKTYRWYRLPAPCRTPPDVLQDMADLTRISTEVFKELSIPTAICYGTLWGVLRQGSFLPWDRNVDFCVLSSEISKVSDRLLRSTFLKKGVRMSEFSVQSGIYQLARGRARGELNVFGDCTSLYYKLHPEFGNEFPVTYPEELREVPKWSCAMGLLPTMARAIYKLNQPFPTWLLQAPFPTRTLQGLNVSVPKDNIEIQKYLYPDDWWLESKPPGC